MTDPDGLWIATQPAADGAYVAVLEIGPDLSVPLTHTTAARYAQAVLDAALRAVYDRAILAQYALGVGADEVETASTVWTVGQIRPPVDDDATKPLKFTPGITAAGEPFIAISLDGREIGQFTPADALQHAAYVLQGPITADLDGAYHRWLRIVLGFDDTSAAAMIGDLAKWRTTDTPADPAGDTENGNQ